LIFQVAPQPFHGMEFRAIGRQEDRYGVGWPASGFGFMKGAIIQLDDSEGLWKGCGKAIHPNLAHLAVEVRQCEKAALAGSRCDSPVEIERVDGVRHRRHGLHPTGRDAPPDERPSAQPSFILGKHFERTDCRPALKLLETKRGQGRLQLRHRFWAFFAWEGRGRFGVARSLYRTSAWTLAYERLT
jgi:hypothetical protein